MRPRRGIAEGELPYDCTNPLAERTRSNCFRNFEILHFAASIDNKCSTQRSMLIQITLCSSTYTIYPIASDTIFWGNGPSGVPPTAFTDEIPRIGVMSRDV